MRGAAVCAGVAGSGKQRATIADGVPYSTNSSTGQLQATRSRPPFGVLTVANGVMYVVDGNDLMTFAAAGCGATVCRQLANLDMPATVAYAAEPVVVNGRVFVALDDGTIAAFGLPVPA